MLLLITYDISTQEASGQKRLSKIAKLCQNYGQRVQNSVFECNVDNVQSLELKAKIIKLMDKSSDSIRFYNLGNNYKSRIEHYGTKESYDPEGILMM